MNPNIEIQQNTPEWLEARRKGIGASEAAAILGVSPWKTALEVYFDKLHMLPDEEKRPKPWLKWGLRLQTAIAEAYTEQTGRELVVPSAIIHNAQAPWMLASLDFQVKGERRPVEAKRVSSYSPIVKQFGPSGSQEIPECYSIQLNQQMACADADCADCAALINNDDFRVYTIGRNQKLIDRLIDEEREFMDRVARRDPPLPDFAHPTTAEILALIEPDEDSDLVLLDEEHAAMVDEFVAMGEQMKERDKRRDEVKARLIHALGNAAVGALPDGRMVKRSKVDRGAYTVEPCSYITFRVSQPKKKGARNGR